MNITNLVLVSLSILLPSLFLIRIIRLYKKTIENKSFRGFLKSNSWELFTILFLIIGFILRLYKIGQLPMGFNQDEASIGYDAFAILNSGIDRNGVSLPVHLIAWGSGQNALYAYICMPFIKLFGLSEFAVRLPMALIGCISLIVMKKLFETIGNAKLTAIGIFLFSIMPWHIMKSRWGLESNIFPDLVLWASVLIILGVMYKKHYLYLGSIILGLTAYSYGTSYFFLPVFLLMLLGYLIYCKKIKIKHALISISIVFAASLPIIIFVLINQFDLGIITTPLFSIPKLNQARQASIINLDGNIFTALYNNIVSGLKLLVIQNDNLPWNSISFYGTQYVISLPFLFIGIFTMLKKKGFKINMIFFFWLLTSILMLSIMSANINRINIIYIPIIYFIILGVYTIIDSVKLSLIPVMAVYLVVAVMFVSNYFGSYQDSIKYYFFSGLGEAIEYSSELDTESITISKVITAPYIYTLFYNKYDPNEYINSVTKLNEGSAFEQVSGFDRYEFKNINTDSLKENSVYIFYIIDIEKIRQLYPEAVITVFDTITVINFN